MTLETEAKDCFHVDPLRLARYPVTWVQYRAFREARDGYSNADWWDERPRADFRRFAVALQQLPGDQRVVVRRAGLLPVAECEARV